MNAGRLLNNITYCDIAMPCRIRRDGMAKHRQYAIMLFLGTGCILAVTIVHDNVNALIHGHHSEPPAHSNTLNLSASHLAPYFQGRKLLQM